MQHWCLAPDDIRDAESFVVGTVRSVTPDL